MIFVDVLLLIESVDQIDESVRKTKKSVMDSYEQVMSTYKTHAYVHTRRESHAQSMPYYCGHLPMCFFVLSGSSAHKANRSRSRNHSAAAGCHQIPQLRQETPSHICLRIQRIPWKQTIPSLPPLLLFFFFLFLFLFLFLSRVLSSVFARSP